MIIIGENNRGVGKKIYISGDNINVEGNNNLVYNTKSNIFANTNNTKTVKNTVRGNNILRTLKYEINFDEIPAILRGYISKCIKLLDF